VLEVAAAVCNNTGESVAFVTLERGDRGCPRPVLGYCMEVAV